MVFKVNYIVFIFLFVSICLYSQSSSLITFDDDGKEFNIDNDYVKIMQSSGYLNITAKEKSPSTNMIFPILLPSEFEVEINVKFEGKVDNSSFSLNIGDTNTVQYQFKINNLKYYKLLEQRASIQKELTNYQRNDKINTGAIPNSIIATLKDGILNFKVNHIELIRIQVNENIYKFGISVSRGSNLKIDYLRIKDLIEQEKINKIEKQKILKYKESRVNLGNNVNSKFNESYVLTSSDNKYLFVTRKHHPENKGSDKKDDIWFAESLTDSTWGRLVNIDSPLNNENSNSAFSIAPDNNTIYLLNQYSENSKESRNGISKSIKINGKWTKPINIEIDNYRNINDFASYFMSPDEKVLFLSLENEYSLGDLDLYVSFRKVDGNYSTPKNIGNVLNTNFTEYAPFLASDGKTLYFSSTGHKGYGSFDLYYTKRLDDTWLNWSEPQNLGEEVNTASAELAYSITSNGQYAYLVTYDSTISIGSADIVRIKLPEQIRPEKVNLVKLDSNYGQIKEVIARNITNPKDSIVIGATSLISLPLGKDYEITIKSDDETQIDTIKLSKETEFKIVEVKAKIDTNKVINEKYDYIRTYYFEYNKSNLTKESKSEFKILDLKELKDVSISIFCDAKGEKKFNKKLGALRLKEISKLLKKKYPKLIIRATNYGSELSNCKDEECLKKERRVELRFRK
jgi:outer membrane protein OmpA-like peptidoglycan-associated protein